jgi:hypothetical protein
MAWGLCCYRQSGTTVFFIRWKRRFQLLLGGLWPLVVVEGPHWIVGEGIGVESWGNVLHGCATEQAEEGLV